jgi:hypothetical protein
MAFNSFNSINRLIKISNPSTISSEPSGKNVIDQTNLVFYYDFEQSAISGSTLKNIASNAYDATIVGNPIQTTTYKNGLASLQSSVGNYIHKTDFTNMTSTNQTMCLWLKTTSISASFGSIVYCYNSTTTSYASFIQAYFNGTVNRLRFYVNGSTLFLAVNYNLNQWYHICYIKNGTTLTLYIDGTQVATTSSGQTLFTTSSKMALGFDLNQPTYPHLGFIDDFRIYNRAITTTELNTIRTSTL